MRQFGERTKFSLARRSLPPWKLRPQADSAWQTWAEVQIEQAGAEPDSERIFAYQVSLRELPAAEQKNNL